MKWKTKSSQCTICLSLKWNRTLYHSNSNKWNWAKWHYIKVSQKSKFSSQAKFSKTSQAYQSHDFLPFHVSIWKGRKSPEQRFPPNIIYCKGWGLIGLFDHIVLSKLCFPHKWLQSPQQSLWFWSALSEWALKVKWSQNWLFTSLLCTKLICE